ncbi:MAG TPA: hypothetical protein VF591_27165 [Pyrinomonadaceae bacterium]|jgi:hypothetical protein
MRTSRNFKALLLLAASLLSFHPHAHAQSGRKPPPETLPGMRPAPAPADHTHFDKVKLVVSEGIYNFVEALNEQGRLGYRLEKTVSYGDPNNRRKYAAVLRLDPGHSYDYVSDSMPEEVRRYGDPLNHHAGRGYGLAHAYARTQCRMVDVSPDPNYPNDTSPRQELQAVQRSNVLLFMRRDAAERQTKEYRVFKGLFTPDGGQKKELQAGLDAAPPGFRPVRLLFSGAGPDAFYVTVVAERDLDEAAPRKAEYSLVKEVFGFEDEVNRLAAAGSRYVDGGRIQFVKIALLERLAGGADGYTFVDDSGDQKRFEREAAAGNGYAGLLVGDLTCTSDSRLFLQKLVFARDAGGGPAREYKVLKVAERKLARLTGLPPADAVSELQSLFAEGFRVRDIFYSHGLYVILERRAEAPASQVQTSKR